MPSAGIRYAAEAALLIVLALGLGLAGFDPIVIVVVMLVACALVALLERASAKEASRSKRRDPLPMHVERLGSSPAATEEPELEHEVEPEPTVSERSARAILASAPPPRPPETPKARPKPQPARLHRPCLHRLQRRSLSSKPSLRPRCPARRASGTSGSSSVRFATPPTTTAIKKWSALLIHLREFANADGDLPLEFDGLVRESFGPLLARSAEPAATP